VAGGARYSIGSHSSGCSLTTRQTYASYALDHPDLCKVVAIAEPLPNTRKQFAELFNVDNRLIFNTWQDLHAASTETLTTTGERLADAVIIAVQDRMHLEVTQGFANQGYHILCEKPMATSVEECIKIEQVIKGAGVIFGMGHGMYRLEAVYCCFI
jgi:predicted dehydrogenase